MRSFCTRVYLPSWAETPSTSNYKACVLRMETSYISVMTAVLVSNIRGFQTSRVLRDVTQRSLWALSQRERSVTSQKFQESREKFQGFASHDMRTSSYEGCAQTNLATPAPGLDQQKAKEYLGMGDFFFPVLCSHWNNRFLKTQLGLV